MARGEFYTMNIWEIRPGFQGRELEDLTERGIVPQYGKVPGVLAVKLFRIDEGDDTGKYMAMTVYESREAYNRWWTQEARTIQAWQDPYKTVTDRWFERAMSSRTYRATLVVDQEFQQPEDARSKTAKPDTGPIRSIF